MEKSQAKSEYALGLNYLVLAILWLRLALLDRWPGVIIEIFHVGLNAAALAGLLMAVIGLAVLLKNGLKKPPALWWLLLLILVWNGLLLFIHSPTDVALQSLVRGLDNLLLFWLGYNFFCQLPKIRRFKLVMLLSAIVIISQAVYQFFTGTGNWETAEFPNRLSGPFAHPNNLGFVAGFLIIILLGFCLWQRERYRAGAIVSSITIILLGWAVLMTYSRGAWLALAVGVGLWCLLLNARATFKAAGVVILALIIAIGLYLAISPSSPRAALENLGPVRRLISTTFSGEDSTIASRFEIWRVSWHLFKAQPLLGVGAGNFNDAYNQELSRWSDDEGFFAAHNDYLWILVEQGVIGLILFLTLIALWYRQMLASVKLTVRGTTERLISVTLLAAGTLLFVGGFFDNIVRLTGCQWAFWLITGAWFGFYPGKISGLDKSQHDDIL